MIYKLTKEQEEKIPIYLKNALAIGHRTDSIDKDAATKSVHSYYDFLKIERPKNIIFLDSPISCILTINVLKKIKDSQLHLQLLSQLHSQLHSQLDSQLDSQLYSELYSELDSQLYSQLDFQLYSELRSQLYSEFRFEYIYETRSNLWGPYYHLYSFILNEIFPDKKPEFEKFTEFMSLNRNHHHIYLYDEMAFISNFPEKISKNENLELHCETGPAIKYRDGFEVYALGGIRIAKEMLNYNASEIMSVKNVEQRLVLIKNLDAGNMLNELEAKDKSSYLQNIGE